MSGPADPFPTAKLTVPYLTELVPVLRDPKQQRLIVIFHAESREEGEWVMQNAASRLTRNKEMLVCGPEPNRIPEILEQAMRMKAQVAFAGEIREVKDAHALRSAAVLGLRVVAFLAVKQRAQFDAAVAELGPWDKFNLLSLSRH